MTRASLLRPSKSHRAKAKDLRAKLEQTRLRNENWELFNKRLAVNHQARDEGLATPWSTLYDYNHGLDTWLVFDTIEQYREYDAAWKSEGTYQGTDQAVIDALYMTPRPASFPRLVKPPKKEGFLERLLGI